MDVFSQVDIFYFFFLTEVDPSLSKDSGSKEPPKKKSKLLGDLDLNSPEVQRLLKKKSKHTGALAEVCYRFIINL